MSGITDLVHAELPFQYVTAAPPQTEDTLTIAKNNLFKEITKSFYYSVPREYAGYASYLENKVKVYNYSHRSLLRIDLFSVEFAYSVDFSASFNLIGEVPEWDVPRDDSRVIVWDIKLKNSDEWIGHACIAVFLPCTSTLYVCDPRPQSWKCGWAIRERLLKACKSRDMVKIDEAIFEVPEELSFVALRFNEDIDIDEKGVCMLWCCLFLDVVLLGVSWNDFLAMFLGTTEKATNIDGLTNAIIRAQYVLDRVNRGLQDIPQYFEEYTLHNRVLIVSIAWTISGKRLWPGNYINFYDTTCVPLHFNYSELEKAAESVDSNKSLVTILGKKQENGPRTFTFTMR